MAYAVQLTIHTGSQVTLGEQVQEVGVALTFELERSDTDLMHLVEEKAAEVAKAHKRAWRVLRDQAVESACEVNSSDRENAVLEEPSSVQNEQEAVLRTSLVSTETASANNSNAPVPSSTLAQHAAIRRLLERTELSEDEVSQAAQVPFTTQSLSALNRSDASKVLLALQRVERGCY